MPSFRSSVMVASLVACSFIRRMRTSNVSSLSLRVTTMKRRFGYIYRVELFLVEPVVLIRNKIQREAKVLEIPVGWGIGRLSDIREKAGDTVNEFIRAWEAANTL